MTSEAEEGGGGVTSEPGLPPLPRATPPSLRVATTPPYKYLANPDGKIKWQSWGYDEGLATPAHKAPPIPSLTRNHFSDSMQRGARGSPSRLSVIFSVGGGGRRARANPRGKSSGPLREAPKNSEKLRETPRSSEKLQEAPISAERPRPIPGGPEELRIVVPLVTPLFPSYPSPPFRVD